MKTLSYFQIKIFIYHVQVINTKKNILNDKSKFEMYQLLVVINIKLFSNK